MPIIEAKNVKIGGRAILYEVHGDAVILQFGDGHYTEQEMAMIRHHLSNTFTFKLQDINEIMRTHSLTQSIISLPRAEAVFNDYQNKKKTGPCFKGTREALLQEMADWFTGPSESRMYVLSGLAGIGKSTVAYTVAARTADLGILGASFFFSRDEADRKNAKKFFTTIAYQLCVYDETFAKAIGDVLMTERGSAAVTKDPQEQLHALIVDPLRSIVQSRTRPILVVVDALDECDEDDEHTVVMGLSQLVRLLPSFKIILTTRPQPLVDYLFSNHDGHKIFYLQDIEDKVVDGDIRLYLSHSFSREQVQARLRNPKEQWFASDAEIESLVRIAGRLFIIASTSVLFVLNKTLGDPGARMKMLLDEFVHDRVPFHALNHFYSTIIRCAIQGDDEGDILDLYRIIVGTIVIVQTALPVGTLACLIGEESEKIYAMLRNLQSVIILGSDDAPHIYHKSFPDYLTDQLRCKDRRLRIEPMIHHTWFAIRCFEIMDKHLKYNILGIGVPARFMSNEDGLREDGITDEQLQEKIPQHLRYACVYWANHLEVANIDNINLMSGFEKFTNEHMLHWFEALSLIGKLDSAHRAIRAVLKLMKSTSTELHQLWTDALRFISKFYELIKGSALHIYYSALPFAPTASLLYRRYIKEAVHICDIDGGPEKWDAFVTNLSHGSYVEVIKFSLDSTLFASCSKEHADNDIGVLKIWDATTGVPISTIPGQRFAVSNELSTVASFKDNTITFYNVNGSARNAIFTTSPKTQKLALSSESHRLAAASSDGTVWLWDSRNAQLINSFDGFGGGAYRSQLQFSHPGTRLAYSSAYGIVKLRDGTDGSFVANLQCGSGHSLYFIFSGDSSRIASLSRNDHRGSLMLWGSETGELIGTTNGIMDVVGLELAMSTNGSHLATAGERKVHLWSGDLKPLAQIEVPGLAFSRSMAFSQDNILAIATISGISLYDIENCTLVSTLTFTRAPTTLAFSKNCTRLVAGDVNGKMYLWDIQGIKASSGPLSKGPGTSVSRLALSRDCSRLACGFDNGVVELWETIFIKQRIASHKAHTRTVSALGFDPDGGLFASGSHDGTMILWDGRDGELRATVKAPSGLRAVAVSTSIMAATWNGGVILWSLDTLSVIHTFEVQIGMQYALSIADHRPVVAFTHNATNQTQSCNLSLFDLLSHTTIATFNFPYRFIHVLAFPPDDSYLVAQEFYGYICLLDLINNHIIQGPVLEHLIQLRRFPVWCGALICHYGGAEHCLGGLFPQHQNLVPVLRIPSENIWMPDAQGSSVIALGCEDGRVTILRFPTSYATTTS